MKVVFCFSFQQELTCSKYQVREVEYTVRLICLLSICNEIYDTDHFKSIYDALENVLDKAQLHPSNPRRVSPNKSSELQKLYY